MDPFQKGGKKVLAEASSESLSITHFPFSVDPFQKGDKNHFDRASSSESLSIPLFPFRVDPFQKGGKKF